MSATIDPQNCNIALLAGGKSGEREVSLMSGEGARQALVEAGFTVTVLDPAKKEDLHALIDGDYDVAFIALHGKQGEDGTIQGFLDIIGLPYVGSGVWASAVSIDKPKAKVFYERANIKNPPSILIKKDEFEKEEETQTARILEEIGLPCVVKPSSEGSALGVYIVDNQKDLEKALFETFETNKEALIEKYITGVELTVAVLGNSDPIVLPVIEIIPKNDFYDYESKYAQGGSEHICPANISDEHTLHVQEMAVEAHKVLGCAGMSRSDFIMDENGEIWILETNTIPGMTKTSLLPDAGRVAGMEFSELCFHLIEYALEEK